MNDNDRMAADAGELGALMQRAGSRYDAAGVRALLEGVLAAPPGFDPDGWMELVAERRIEALDPALRALLREVARRLPAHRPPQGGVRAAALRAVLAERGLDGFLVPRAD